MSTFNNNFRSSKLPTILLFLSALALFVYTCLRAHLLSMTHDESGSFFIWTNFDIFSCFIDPGCWRTANLHFLYVLIMKATVGLFGDAEISIRMPSLIGHLIYLFFSWRLVKMWTDKPWLRLFGFLFINLNPFLLEFFALGRGYGLANAFLMLSLFYAGAYLKNQQKVAAWGMFLGASLAVLSNFTMLNYYACMVGGIILVFLFVALQKEKVDWRPWKYLLAVGSIVSILLLVLLYMPITSLSGQGEFEYGAKSFWDTFSSGVKSALYNVKYFSSHHVEILGGVFLLLLIAGLLNAFVLLSRKAGSPQHQFGLLAACLPALVALASVVQHYLLGVNYLVGRTTLAFIPLTSVALFMFLVALNNKKHLWRKAIPLIIALFCVVHAFRSFQLTHSREWWYDANTEKMMAYMDRIIPAGKQVKLGMHWIFHPTSKFYQIREAYDFTETMNYEKQFRKDVYYDYYYIQPGEAKLIHPRYKVEKEFLWSGILMVRDSL